MNTSNLKKIEYLRSVAGSLPVVPGCYLFKDIDNNIIYVGKAKILRNRVGSYFNTSIQPGTKTYALVHKINDIEHVEASSELEAFVLEAELIKKYKPKYNINLKDDKSYLFIVIRNEKLSSENDSFLNIPVITTARKNDLKKGDISFGPYPDGSTTKYVVKTIRKIFPFRDCAPSKFYSHKSLKRACLFGDLGLCSAPCINNDLDSYKKNITNVKKFLSGESTTILKDLTKQMHEASKNLDYEQATKYRDLITKFEYITTHFRSPYQYIENPYLLDDLANESLEELKKNIPLLKTLPVRIECYDIANISGKEAVGAMTVATNGKIDTSEYKKFKIRLKNTPDDFGMLQEVLSRRLSHETEGTKLKSWGVPDLLLIDGGKGQVSSIQEVVDTLGLKIPVIGLAKKFETIVYKYDNEFVELSLEKSNKALQLLIKLRDEAHRFGQKYHHYLRSKKMYN